MESGGLITAEEAERRVLILENPGMRGESRATNTLFAGVQMILPGEVAPAHRHVSSAIRFVLDGEGAYTAVEGEKSYHGARRLRHHRELGAARPRQHVEEADAVARRARLPAGQFLRGVVRRAFRRRRRRRPAAQDGDSLAFYGSGVLPDGAPAHLNRSPVINYTYARTRPIVERMMKAGDIDKRHGARVRYANPINGGPVLPTMGAEPRAAAEGLQGREVPLDRRHHLRLRRGQGHDHGRRQGRWNGARTTSSWCRRGSTTPTTPRRSRCCSRSPTGPRRKRSASGARTPHALGHGPTRELAARLGHADAELTDLGHPGSRSFCVRRRHGPLRRDLRLAEVGAAQMRDGQRDDRARDPGRDSRNIRPQTIPAAARSAARARR